MKFSRLLVLLAFVASPAFGQVRQSGTVTPRHAACWTASDVIQDCGTAAIPFLSSIGTVGGGPTICASSAATTGAYNQLCLGANTSSNAQISLQSFGGATPQGLDFSINGTTFSLPSPGAPLPVAVGGTGATTAAGARTNLGLGTMAIQNSTGVSITGGAITGMPTPLAASDVTNKAYVDSVLAGLHILAPSRLATAAILPNSPTYSNGASGVGATLTSGSNSTLTVDGTVAALADVVLVKNQASAFQNGIYTVTTAGDGSTPWVLTRATYFDQAAEMLSGSYTLITAGSANAGNAYVLSTTVATVGTNSVTFFLFTSTASNVTAFGGVSGPISIAPGFVMSGSTLTVTASCGTALQSNGSGALVCGTLPYVVVTSAPFSAACDGVTDDTAAIQSAINSGASIVVIPAATCAIGTVGALTLVNNQEIVGVNRFTSILKLTVNPTGPMITASSKTGWVLRNLTLDFNNKTPGGVNGVIDTGSSSDWIVDRVRIIHIKNYGIIIGGTNDFTIQDSYIQKDTADASAVNSAILMTAIGGVSQRGRIYRNRIVNVGLGGASLANSFVEGNIVDGPGYGSGLSLDYGANGIKNNVVAFNNIQNGLTTLGFDSTVPIGIENYGYNTVGIGNIVATMGGGGIQNGGGWNAWSANVTVNNGQRSLVGGCAVVCQFGGFEIRRIDGTTNTQYTAYTGNMSANNSGTPSQQWAFIGINTPTFVFMNGNVAVNGTVQPIDLGAGAYHSFVGTALQGTFTLDPPSIAAGAGRNDLFTLSGTTVSDWVVCSFSNDLQGITLTAYVAGANNITTRLQNGTAGALDLASGTLTCTVYKPTAAAAL